MEIEDMRNKLTPFKNLIAILEMEGCVKHEDARIQEIINQEIIRCKENIEYLSTKGAFKPCGEGDNICSCKSLDECGYI